MVLVISATIPTTIEGGETSGGVYSIRQDKICPSITIHGCSFHLGSQEPGGRSSVSTVGEMGSCNNESSITDQVAYGAIYFSLVFGVVRDLTLVLQVASETEQDNTLNLVPDF